MASNDILKYHKEGRFNFKRSRDGSLESVQKKRRVEESTRSVFENGGKKSLGFYHKKSGRKFNSSRRSNYRSGYRNYYRNSHRSNGYEKSKIESQKKESKEEDSRQEETGEIEEFLVWRPAQARKHSSEGFEVGKVIEAIEAPAQDNEGVGAVTEDNEGVGAVAEDNEGVGVVAEDNEGV